MVLEAGVVLNNRYRIIGQLGKGGMGTVYLAFDETLELRVALKENLNTNPEAERQFKREATILAGLHHPNLPRVTDHFILDGRQYLVMDYVEGENLHEIMHRNPPKIEDVLEWAEKVCDALNYLHTRQPPVIHRDIKPANIKVRPDGQVSLVDFGIAKIFDKEQTTTGARGLTPGYSPPEQYGGQRTDPSSDQYSLASTVYHMLTGQIPADSFERLIGKSELKPAREYNPAIPAYVDQALQRAMALEQKDRFPNIVMFAQALKGATSTPTVRAEAPKPRRKIPVVAWLGISLVGLAVVAGGGWMLLGGGFTSDPTPTNDQNQVAQYSQAPTRDPALSSQLPPPPPTPTQGPTATVTETPTQTPIPIGGGGRIAFVSDREDGRTLQVWVMNPDGSDPVQITFGPGNKSEPAWSPDGQRLLYVAPGGTDEFGNDLGLDIFVINIDRSGQPVNLTQSPGDDTSPAWSPDGTRIAFTSNRVNNLRQVFIAPITCQPLPDGCALPEEPDNFSGGFAVEYEPEWSPDSHRIGVIGSINGAPGRIFLRSALGGQPEWLDNQDRIIGADDVSWSPDGNYLAFTWIVQSGKVEIYIIDLNNIYIGATSLTNSLGNRNPDFSPDGQMIVFTSTRDQNPEIYVMTSSGSGQENITNNSSRDLEPAWGPAPQ
jgi:serine/threonine protein kinase